MKKYLVLLCAFVSLSINAQSVSESEAFQKAQKFLNDKKLKAPRATTRGEEVYNPYYIFNAEDGKGCVIISGDERLPEVLAYSKEESIDENNLPEGLEEILPILKTRGSTRGETYGEIPSEYVPRNTTPIPCLMDYVWKQGSPLNQYCPILYEEGSRSDIHALVGCVPLAISEVMAFFKYPDSVDEFVTSYTVQKEGEVFSESSYIRGVTVPYTEFKWNLIRNEKYSSSWSDEEEKAVAELCYHVGRAFGANYAPSKTCANSMQYYFDWEIIMKDIYKYDEVKFLGGEWIQHTDYWEYIPIPDEDYWNFLDSYLERGVPVVVGGGGHEFVIDGRDDKGMYCWIDKHLYVIFQPSLWEKIGDSGALVKYNNKLHMLAFIPPKEHTYRYIPKQTPTAINSVEVKKDYDGFVYNLQGQEVGNTLEGLPKGVYIKDGKKQVVK